jgi:hypothetical protein
LFSAVRFNVTAAPAATNPDSATTIDILDSGHIPVSANEGLLYINSAMNQHRCAIAADLKQ